MPNSHIAETFKGVLVACELESMYPDVYHKISNANNGGADSVPDNRKLLYDVRDDGLFYKKGTYEISFLRVIHEYFDNKRLKTEGAIEIHRTYQKLREKEDYIRNNLILINIVIPKENNMLHKVNRDLRSHKIRI